MSTFRSMSAEMYVFDGRRPTFRSTSAETYVFDGRAPTHRLSDSVLWIDQQVTWH